MVCKCILFFLIAKGQNKRISKTVLISEVHFSLYVEGIIKCNTCSCLLCDGSNKASVLPNSEQSKFNSREYTLLFFQVEGIIKCSAHFFDFFVRRATRHVSSPNSAIKGSFTLGYM